MNKKTHKKKRKRGKGGDGGKEKDSLQVEVQKTENGSELNSGDTHEKENLCYEIKTSEIMGRYIVATKNIEPGEVIIEEPALVVGPCTGCNIICLGCYHEVDDTNMFKCPDCNWPLCDAKCPGRGKTHGHSTLECTTLKKVVLDYKNLEDVKDSYQAITPLRCLLLKSTDSKKWSLVNEMEPHNEIRRKRPDIWENNQKHVVNRLRQKWGFTDYSEEEIHTICGILEVNAFEVGGGAGGASARALYDRAYLLAHDCTPSTTHTDASTAPERTLTVRAATAHRPGDLISLCYAYTLQGTLKRREHIQHSKFFWCSCRRCADPTELGTFASAFRCPRCAAGRVLPARPLRPGAWACTAAPAACQGYVMSDEGVQMLLKRLTDEYEQIDVNDLPAYENFLHKYRNVLHPTHYLCLCAKHSLSQLYGKITNYMIQDMPETELNRKIDICRDIMKAFDIIEPGYSRLRGVTLYELHAPLMILATRNFEKKAISKENLRTRLQEIVGYLNESATILSLEPKQSAEGLMAAAAKDALSKIKTWEKIIGKIS